MGQIPLNHYAMGLPVSLQVDTVSGTASLCVPYSGTLERIVCALDGADMDVGTNVLGVEHFREDGTNEVFNHTIDAALNDNESFTIFPRQDVRAGDRIRFVSDGDQVGVTKLWFTLEFSK